MSTKTPYRSKLHDSKEFRVVRVSAGRWDDPIRCMLIQRKLDEVSRQSYRALSYVWGLSSVTDTIDLEGLPFEITLNLSCALRHLRKVDEEVFLWVDALCINQKDHKERGLQVSIMQLIYKNAEQVVVFMGDGRGHRVNRSHLREAHISPMTTLNGHERNKLFLTDMLSASHFSGPRKLVSSLPAADCALGLISLFSDQETVEEGCVELMKLSERNRCDLFEHFRAFVTCPWWSRIWVVQEIAVATVVTIHYGPITLPWDAMVATANVWSLPKTRQVAISEGIEPENLKVFSLFANQLTGLEQARRKWHAEGGTDLVRLLQEFSDRQATDDRDKVYGLLSLAKRGQKYVEPNYELDVFQAYRSTALALIANGGSLACWAGDQKRKFNRGLPSWIPDWSTAIDNGEKRRMDLFESYDANRGWNLRCIKNEMEYWTTVEDEMELLMNSPAGQELPESLYYFVLRYIELLMLWCKTLGSEATTDELEDLNRGRFAWDRQEPTVQSTLKSLEWCESNNVFPRCGGILLRRWIRDVRGQHGIFVQLVGEQEISSSRKIGRCLGELEVILREALAYGGPEHRTQHAQSLVYEIESIVLAQIQDKKRLVLAIEGVIDSCRRLSSLCKATDNAISPSKLFKSSYILRGTASWLTEYQSASSAWKITWFPDPMPDPMLAMQMVLVDSVTDCGPRQFGWTDIKSALITLVSWLYLSCPVIASGEPAEPGEVQLNHARIRQFAKTIVGGMCRRGGAYHKADDTPLGPLEDWLRQCLMVSTGPLAWESLGSDNTSSRGGFITLEDWIQMSERERLWSRWRGNDHEGGPVVPQQGWLRRSLESRDFAAPPSPFFEDIQVATDGRVFFLTGNGSMGLGPASMRTGDTIHVLPSGRAYFVLRSKPMESIPPEIDHPEWMKDMRPNRYEIIGDCYLYTNSTLDGRMEVKEEPVVEGSLPFELLGARYFESRGLPTRETAVLV